MCSWRVALPSLALIALLHPLAGTPGELQGQTLWGIYSDANYRASTDDEVFPHFAIGGVDFFVVQRLGSRARVLSEDVLEILDDGVVFDLERIHIEYDLTDFLSVRAGRMHLPLGVYSEAYHHGTLFSVATARPLLLGFEDEGGVLPAHVVGVDVFGRIGVGDAGALAYDVFVGNGRGQFADDILAVDDRNDHKAIGGRVSFSPPSIPFLEVGVNAYFDRIPDGFTDEETGEVIVPEPLDERILGAHVHYDLFPVNVLGEIYTVRHEGSGPSTGMTGGFLQLSLTRGVWTPYARYDRLSRDEDDPFFIASGAPVVASELRGGIRYRYSELAVVKAELIRDLEGDHTAFVIQSSFGFGG